MAESEQYPESSRSLDSLREMRLVALLGDLIDEQSKTQAAKTLGVSPRTLTRFEDGRRLTPTLAGALERHLLEGGSAAATQRHRLGMLEDGLQELERALREGLAALRREGRRPARNRPGPWASWRGGWRRWRWRDMARPRPMPEHRGRRLPVWARPGSSSSSGPGGSTPTLLRPKRNPARSWCTATRPRR